MRRRRDHRVRQREPVSEHASENLVEAVSPALQSAMAQVFITIAWIAWCAAASGSCAAAAVAVFAGYVIGVAFGWDKHTLLTSEIPATLVLFAGCLIVREQWNAATFHRCGGRATAVIALTWLFLSGLLQVLLWICAWKRSASTSGWTSGVT